MICQLTLIDAGKCTRGSQLGARHHVVHQANSWFLADLVANFRSNKCPITKPRVVIRCV